MEHASQPTLNYDFAKIASLLGKYNIRDYEVGNGKVEDELRNSLSNMESSDKPPVPHSDPELIKGVQSFLAGTVLTILKEAGGKVPQDLQSRIRILVRKFNERISILPKGNLISCDLVELERMFGVDLSKGSLEDAADEESRSWRQWEKPDQIKALDRVITIEEVRGIFEVVREKVLKVKKFSPSFYLDRPERHHLFWSPTETGQECTVPNEYSMADYLRFHSPHNDAHLMHLNSLAQQGITSYCDNMDERAFFEAVAVYAEWKMFEATQNGSFAEDLYSQFSLGRQRGISKNQLQDWILRCRGHEFHLRAVRLLGDLHTFHSGTSFDGTVNRTATYTGISRQEIESEVRKYYHFPGLGATYTMGFRKLKEQNHQF